MFNQLNLYLQNLYPTICNSLPTSHLKKGVMCIPGRPQRIIFGLRIRRTAQKVACAVDPQGGDPSRPLSSAHIDITMDITRPFRIH